MHILNYPTPGGLSGWCTYDLCSQVSIRNVYFLYSPSMSGGLSEDNVNVHLSSQVRIPTAYILHILHLEVFQEMMYLTSVAR
jgi:hypothetical protein